MRSNSGPGITSKHSSFTSKHSASKKETPAYHTTLDHQRNMRSSIIISAASLFGLGIAHADTLVERSVNNGPCTGQGSAPGVCIPTGQCSSGGGSYISNACPGLPNDIKCCTKPSCGNGGNCRFTSQCQSSTVSDLCPGPADFKCCVPGGGGGGGYPTPSFPAVGACKARAVNGAKAIVSGNPGKVRQIYCIRDCACPGTSDHCCGLATDMMCSSAGGVSTLSVYVLLNDSLRFPRVILAVDT